MDVVWVISLCLSMLAIVVTILSVRKKTREEDVTKEKEVTKPAAEQSSGSSGGGGGGGGKGLEFSEDELDRYLARMTEVVYSQEAQRAAPSRTRFSEETRYQPAPAIHSYSSPLGAPESGHWHEEIAKQPPEIEHILSEIEQAVQETVEPEDARRSRRRQYVTTFTETRTEIKSKDIAGEGDNM